MSAIHPAARTAKRAPVPATLEQLNAELTDFEHQLHEARRAANATRNELPRLIVAGDTAAVAECRERAAWCEERIKELTGQIEAAREAARLAEQRDRGKANGQAYKAIREAIADEITALEGIEAAITAFAASYIGAHKGLEALEVKMRQAGIQPDPLALRAKLQGIVDRGLHLATNGQFGNLRGLETPAELRARGAGSLTQAGREFQIITLRQVRHALRIPEEI